MRIAEPLKIDLFISEKLKRAADSLKMHLSSVYIQRAYFNKPTKPTTMPTLTEKINQALSDGVLNYNDIKRITSLDRERHENQHDMKIVERNAEKIMEIINNGYMTPGERLRRVNESRK